MKALRDYLRPITLFRIIFRVIFDYLIRSKCTKIQVLSSRKIQIIEDVKQNEKFIVAQEILKKYGSKDDLLLLEGPPKTPPTTPEKEERYKDQGTSPIQEIQQPPRTPENGKVMPVMTPLRDPQIGPKGMIMRRGPVRPFVNPNRTALDKLVDCMIGDGPNNR